MHTQKNVFLVTENQPGYVYYIDDFKRVNSNIFHLITVCSSNTHFVRSTLVTEFINAANYEVLNI